MGYRASVQNSEGRPGDPPDLPSSRKPNRSAHLRRLPRLLRADHLDASAPRPRPGTDCAKRARKVRRRPDDRRPSAHDRRPRDRADPLHPTRARIATPDQPAQTLLAVATAPQNHRRHSGPVPILVVQTFEAKSLIQHAADSRFWPNPRRRDSGGEFDAPPVSETAAVPMRPWKAMPTLVSARTGVALSTVMAAMIARGSSLSSCRLATSPTRMPLNWTAAPSCNPDTVFSNRTR